MTILVAEPLAPRALSTDRIAVVMEGDRLSYAAGARWNERAPRVVQDQLITAFEDDGRVRAAVRPDDGVASRYEVRLDLMRFEAVYTDGAEGAPTVEVAVRAKLIARDDRELLASTRFAASRRAAANTLGAIVDAFDAALDETSGEIVSWTIEAAAAQPSEDDSGPAAMSAS
jgi:cholesterol transport system auxiliary component